jgi:hypothetical protein
LQGPIAASVATSWYEVARPLADSGLAGTISVQFGLGVAAAAAVLVAAVAEALVVAQAVVLVAAAAEDEVAAAELECVAALGVGECPCP